MVKIIEETKFFRDNNIAKLIEKHARSVSFYDLGWGNPNPEMIKYKIPKISYNKNDLSIYWNSRGLDGLIDQILGFIKNKSGISFTRKNILITNGSTNSIFLLSYFFKNFIKINTVLLQNPTYDTAINIFKSQKFLMKATDPDIRYIRSNKIKLCYLIFKLQNPTGLSVPGNQEIEIKKRLLKTSYLIEDDAYSLFEDRNNINLVKNKRYIYVGSFSKYIFPGIRMGYVIADKGVIDKLALIQKYYNSYPNILSQLTLLYYLRTGKLEKEINYKIKIIREKRKLFEHLLSFKVRKLIKIPKSGFYYWLKLPENMDSNKVFIALLKKRVFVIPGDIYFFSKQYNAIRMSISRINKSEIRKAVRILNDFFDKYES